MLAVAHADLTWVLAPLATVVQAVAWLVWLADAVWRPLLITLAVVGVVGVWQIGRRSGALPAWATPAHGRVDATMVITPGGIATALAHLGIPALNRAVKDGWQVEFSTPPVRVNRRGYQAVFSLPMGVTPEMIADKRDVLARNLVRAPLEVWPAAADHAGYVDLWVADPGSTERPAPPYPLLHDGPRRRLRRRPARGLAARRRHRDRVARGEPGLRRVDGAGQVQRRPRHHARRRPGPAGRVVGVRVRQQRRLRRLPTPPGPLPPRRRRPHRRSPRWTGCGSCTPMVSDREGRLADLGAKKVTRTLAERHSELRPVVALFSECHELFGHPGFGQEAADLAAKCCGGAARQRSRWRSTPSPRGRTRSHPASWSW